MRTHPGCHGEVLRGARRRRRQHRDDLDLRDPHLGRHPRRPRRRRRARRAHRVRPRRATTARPSSTEGPADERAVTAQAHARGRRRDRRRRHRDARDPLDPRGRLGRDPARSPRRARRASGCAVRGEEVEVVRRCAEVVRRRRRRDVRRARRGLGRSGRRSPPRKGAVVVDNSGAFRMDPDVPLVVPEVNPDAARNRPQGHHRQPQLHDAVDDRARSARCTREYGLRELVVASYQAASGAGQAGIDSLHDADSQVVAGDRELGTHAGDVRRAIGDKLGGAVPGAAGAQRRAVGRLAQGRRLVVARSSRSATSRARSSACPTCKVSATCVRVPVDHDALAGRARACSSSEVDVDAARAGPARRARRGALRRPGRGRVPDAGRRRRHRPDLGRPDPPGRWTIPNALDLFVCGDNLRKGAALNTAQIAELVAKELTTA